MYQRLNTRLVQVSNIRRRLSRFLARHDRMRVDRSEGVDDDFATDGLDWVDDDGDGTGVQLFKGLCERRGGEIESRGVGNGW